MCLLPVEDNCPSLTSAGCWERTALTWCTTEASELEKDLSQKNPIGLPCSVQAVTSHPSRPSLWTSRPRIRERWNESSWALAVLRSLPELSVFSSPEHKEL